ncbi:MAG: hypothetical protein GAK28_04646 [Luteibacter sp.]|uniref:cupin domain-containing protein n=1 Tax=Luteibacter sp. TaxID=1886636 RepID=UPI0013858870|nr:cupin domain-containing protein [Luteibacter sp.]KAF1003510.1 MAG: hypothetical protein GAK28_04646 [Luteibacter sp.]
MATVSMDILSRPRRLALAMLGVVGGLGIAASVAIGRSDTMPSWVDAICGGVTRMFATPFAGEGARPETIIKPLCCQPLPHVPGKAVTTALVYFPPGAYTPAHRHPGSVSAVVLKGHIRSQLQGTPAETYGATQTWFEPPGTLHLFAENPSATEDAELLATFVADENCGPLTIPEPRS